jgi:hypothetical protein
MSCFHDLMSVNHDPMSVNHDPMSVNHDPMSVGDRKLGPNHESFRCWHGIGFL